MEDNKDVQMFKKELWTRWQIIADITILWKNQVVEETTLLEEIWQNGTKEWGMIKELAKEDKIVYMNGRIYVPNNQKSGRRFYNKIMNQWT